jgi:hypothetical protein
MHSRLTIVVTGTLAITLLASAVVTAWRVDQREYDRMRSELVEAQQALAKVKDQQQVRDAQLRRQLDALAERKRVVWAPGQIISELPNLMGLPAPMVLDSATISSGGDGSAPAAKQSGTLQAGTPAAGVSPGAMIPIADLKPLYNFALNCKSCQAQLDVSQRDLTDERTRTLALTHERDAALRAANGGSVLRRVARATKWFVIGAAAGAVLARTAHPR